MSLVATGRRFGEEVEGKRGYNENEARQEWGRTILDNRMARERITCEFRG